jgi:hypothetical protein
MTTQHTNAREAGTVADGARHTPTPYEVRGDGYSRRIVGNIYAVGDSRIFSTTVCVVSGNETSQNVTQATAEFIARACNSHDALLEACKWVLSVVRHKSFCPAAENRGACDCGLFRVEDAVKKAEAR